MRETNESGTSPTFSLEREAAERLLGVLQGDEVAPLGPGVAQMVVMLAAARHEGSEPSGPATPERLLGTVGLVERALAVLAHPDLTESGLLQVVENVEVARSLPAVRMVVEHPSCTPTVLVRLAVVGWRGAVKVPGLAAWSFLAERSGPYGRAAAHLVGVSGQLDEHFLERAALSLGYLGDDGFEVFRTLWADRIEQHGPGSARMDRKRALLEVIEGARLLLQDTSSQDG